VELIAWRLGPHRLTVKQGHFQDKAASERKNLRANSAAVQGCLVHASLRAHSYEYRWCSRKRLFTLIVMMEVKEVGLSPANWSVTAGALTRVRH
jgi:hypothetical protein